MFVSQVCVNKCPDRTIAFKSPLLDQSSFLELRSNMVCTYDIDVQTLTYEKAIQLIDDRKCASYVIKSEPGKVIHKL